MEQFDDSLPRRRFDNFQFVCLNDCIVECRKAKVQEEIGFALQALMEVPEQYKIINRLGLKNPSQGAKYYKKLGLKPIEVVDPPMGKRRVSVDSSQELMTTGGADSPQGAGTGASLRIGYEEEKEEEDKHDDKDFDDSGSVEVTLIVIIVT